ncbi:hypothetical protein [Streptomyces sp. NPDC048641]|uniref:hypothetical protein n=1 Tax=Streptomyces sp. NPDC048641 TaxID=3154825 RepID=UPI00343402D3
MADLGVGADLPPQQFLAAMDGYRQHPLSSHVIRSDRIVHEVQAAGANVRLICELFGLGIEAATRYTLHRPHPGLTPPA